MTYRVRAETWVALAIVAWSAAIPPAVLGDGAVVPVSGRRLVLKSSLTNTSRKSMTIVSRDAAITLGGGNGSNDDPTIYGGGVMLLSPTLIINYNLAAERWSTIGAPGENRGYKYRDVDTSRPIRTATFKNGTIKVKTHSGLLEHVLGTDPSPVDVLFALGFQENCMRFGGTVAFKAGISYVASNAPPLAACP